jgi:hypothetical protein
MSGMDGEHHDVVGLSRRLLRNLLVELDHSWWTVEGLYSAATNVIDSRAAAA